MPFKSEKQRKWMWANDPEMAKKWEKKEKKMKREQRVKELIKKMVREELAKMNEVRIPFSSSHIKQLKRAFKDMKGTLPDNNPLVQQIVTLLKKTDKKVLKQIANADIKYLSDKAKDILGEGTCGYGENGELGEEPAGPHLIKKKLKEKQSAAVQRMAKKGMWVVYDTPGEQTIKVVKNERAAKMLVKKLKKSGKYNSPEAKAIKLEGKLTEAKETIFDVAARVMKDKQAYGYKTKKGLVTVDMQTANLLTKVFKKVNPKMKKILSDIGYKNPTQLMNTLWAVVK